MPTSSVFLLTVKVLVRFIDDLLKILTFISFYLLYLLFLTRLPANYKYQPVLPILYMYTFFNLNLKKN